MKRALILFLLGYVVPFYPVAFLIIYFPKAIFESFQGNLLLWIFGTPAFVLFGPIFAFDISNPLHQIERDLDKPVRKMLETGQIKLSRFASTGALTGVYALAFTFLIWIILYAFGLNELWLALLLALPVIVIAPGITIPSLLQAALQSCETAEKTQQESQRVDTPGK